MEARDCPALFVWTGKWSVHFSGYTPDGMRGNWLAGASWSNLSIPSNPPGPGDDVYFRADYVQNNANCTWSNNVTEVKSLHIIKSATGGPYTGTIDMGSVLLNNGLEMRTGNISQGPNTTLTVTRSDIYTTSLWDGGVLNSSEDVATVVFTATPMTIDPAGGTLIHGSTLKADNAAKVNILNGTVQTSKDVAILVAGGATLSATSANLIVTLAGALKPIKLEGAASELGFTGTFSTRGLDVAGGKAFILGPGQTTKFSRPTRPNGNASVTMDSGALVIDNGATLHADGRTVVVAGGELATRATHSGVQEPATITTPDLLVWGAYTIAPTEINISNEAYNGPGVFGHQYGMLRVSGRVEWRGGTYRPVVNTSVSPGGGPSKQADIWSSSGAFEIGEIGPSRPMFDPRPGALGAGNTGRTWTVLSSDDEIKQIVATSNYPGFAPEVGPKLWGLDGQFGDKEWGVEYLQ